MHDAVCRITFAFVAEIPLLLLNRDSLHLGACPGSCDLFTVANEALRTQLDALRIDMQRLEVENRRLRGGNEEGLDLVDWLGRQRQAARKATEQLEDLRVRLHESQEEESKAVEAVKDTCQELESLKRRFEEERQQEREQLEEESKSCVRDMEERYRQERVSAELD